MRIDERFTVPASPERVWEFLTDLAQVARCLPGATVESVDGEVLTGRMAVRIGPMNMTYHGAAKFLVKDDENKLATIVADGGDVRGGGTARAKIRANLVPATAGTQVELSTEISFTGRVAHLGPGPITELSSQLVRQLAECAAARITERDTAGPETDGSTRSAQPPGAPTSPVQPLGRASAPVTLLAQAAAVMAALVIAAVLARSRRRRRTR